MIFTLQVNFDTYRSESFFIDVDAPTEEEAYESPLIGEELSNYDVVEGSETIEVVDCLGHDGDADYFQSPLTNTGPMRKLIEDNRL